MIKKKVVVTRELFKSELVERLKNFDLKIWDKEHSPSKSEIIEFSKGASALLTMLSDPIDCELIRALDNSVAIISNYAVGYNNIDVAEAAQRGICVTNTPEVLTNAVAELVIGMMISLGRGFESSSRELREGRFSGWEPEGYLGYQIAGKRVGIVGAGRIGQAIGERLATFECDLVYASRSQKDGLVMCDLDELVKNCDYIILCCSLTPETNHLIDKRRLGLMRESAFLINIGRGALIDEMELIDVLKAKKIGGAALDVYEKEPVVSQELRELENVLLLPHIGSATFTTRKDMLNLAIDNIINVLDGKEAITPVSV